MATYAAEQASKQRKPRVDGKVQAELDIPALGSGSDFTVFLQRLGVASMDQGFGGSPSDGVYHYHSYVPFFYDARNSCSPDIPWHVASTIRRFLFLSFFLTAYDELLTWYF